MNLKSIIQRGVYSSLKENLGTEAIKNVCAVYTRWDYDDKSIRMRKKANISKESRTKELNELISKEFSFDVGKSPIKCFFVDSESFQDPENNDEKSKKLLKEEFDSLRQACLKPERFPVFDDLRVNNQQPFYEESKVDPNNQSNKSQNPEVPIEFSEKRRVCVLGLTGAGKSTLCNALSGNINLFTESTGFESCTYAVKQETVKWFDKEELFHLVDTCGFGDSKENEDQQIKDLVALLRNLIYVNKFLIVLNSQTPRLDSQVQDMLKAFKDIFGDEVCKNISIVFTRWDYDQRSLRERKAKTISEDARTREINNLIKTKIGFDTEKYPMECFFVDSVSIMDAENDDEECKKSLDKEFRRLKTVCAQSEKFICIDAKEYQSHETKLRAIQKEIEKKKNEKEELALTIKCIEKNDQEFKTNLWELAKKEAEEKYERQKALRRRIDTYFTDKGESREPSLYKDIESILVNFNNNDTEMRVQQSRFQKDLMQELNSKLEPKLRERLTEMVKQEVVSFVNNYKEFLAQERFLRDEWIKKLDLETLPETSIALGATLVASGMGLFLTGISFLSVLSAILTPFLVLSGAFFIYQSLGWSREDEIKKLVLSATDHIARRSNLKTKIIEIAEKSFELAADSIGNQARKHIVENYNNN